MAKEFKNFVKTTKKELWDAYKEVLQQLTDAKEGQIQTIEDVQKEEKVQIALNIAEKQDGDKLKSTLEDLISLVDEYKEVTEAIKVKKAELKKVHGITAEADAYVALAQAKDELEQKKTQEAKEIIEKAKIEADEILSKAKEKKEKLDEEILEKATNYNKKVEREQEEYEYNFARRKQEDEDNLEDELNEKRKSLDAREADVKAREDLQKETDRQIDLLNDEIDGLKAEMDAKVKKQVAIIEGQLKKQKEFDLETAKTKHEAALSVKDNENKMLTAQVADLKAQVDKYQALVESANSKVTDIATASLNATASEGTVNAVMDAVGKVSQTNKK